MIGVRKVMTVNLTADHRLVYGASAAEFLQSLKAVIENPEQVCIGVSEWGGNWGGDRAWERVGFWSGSLAVGCQTFSMEQEL